MGKAMVWDGSKFVSLSGNVTYVQEAQPSDPSPGDLWINPAEGAGGAIPIGGVIPYVSANAPTGWLLCDGRSTAGTALAALIANTPDMRAKFILGADPGNSTGFGTEVGVAGGSQKITAQNMPSHSHGGATGWMDRNASHAHSTYGAVWAGAWANAGDSSSGNIWGTFQPGNQPWTYGDITATDTNHLHGIAAEGGNIDYWPRYYTLAYIIRAD